MKVIKLLLCLFVTVLASGCEEDTGYKYFEVKNESALNQTVYAGETQAPMAIEFTTSGAWTSNIEYSTNASATARADVRSSGWITLDPSSGKSAGDYLVNIYIDPDKGDDVYMAIISFICNGEVMEVRIKNSRSLNPGSSEDINDPEKIAAAKEKLDAGFSSVEEVFLELDNDYSTPKSREPLNSRFKILEDFWYDSYAAINTCNLLIEACEQDVITGDERDKVLAKANRYRGMFHFYLSTIFGDVPIRSSYLSDLKSPRSLKKEVMDFVINEMYQTVDYMNSSNYYYDDVYLIRTLAVVLKDETIAVGEDTRNYLRDIINNEISLDVNGDGRVEVQECKDYPVPVQCNLLSAYFWADYDLDYSKERLNYMAEELNDSSFKVEASDIAEKIREKVEILLLSDWDKGMKYFVNRFMLDCDWKDFLMVLPVPMAVMEENENITQNVGWY